MLPYIDGMYSVYYTAGGIVRKISRPAAGRIDTAKLFHDPELGCLPCSPCSYVLKYNV